MKNWIEVLMILSLISSIMSFGAAVTVMMFINEKRYQDKTKSKENE
jgi:Na+-transporting NADH:ubiquinone oxidoreductase subunit NqrC